MDTLQTEFILILVTMNMWIEAGGSKKQDVCNWKKFQASCAENELIQIEQAHYGQMSVGSCIKQGTHSFTRCQVDVLSYLDSVCSGKQKCELALPDQNLVTGNQRCLKNLDSYLHLQFNCTPVYTSPTPCSNNILSVSGANGLLANFITGQTGQGSERCPWEVKGAPGQKVRLTLHDFGVWNPSSSEGDISNSRDPVMLQPKKTGICQIYARITEGPFSDTSERTITICGGEIRENVVYVSGRETVRISLTNPKNSQNPAYFLLKYEIILCPAYIPPEGAVVEYQGDEILVTCPQTGNDWRMSCDGMRWTYSGQVNNCSVSVDPPVSFGNLVNGAQALPQWILIVVIIAAAAIIAVPILVIGIVSFRRKHDAIIASRADPQMGPAKCMSPPQYYAKELDPMLVCDDKSQKYSKGREYTSTAQRNMAVRPDPLTQGERFPPLPLPPTASVPYAGNHGVHGTMNRGQYPRGGNHTIFKPPVTEHKYESPTFLRRTRSESDTTDPVCLELDTEHAQFDRKLPCEQTESDIETQ